MCRARLRPAPPVHLAASADLRDGRRAGGEHADRGEAQPDEANGETIDQGEIDRVWEQTRQAYQEQLSAYYSTSELWDDGIIDPVDTRNALGIAISASLNAPLGDPGYGVFRF